MRLGHVFINIKGSVGKTINMFTLIRFTPHMLSPSLEDLCLCTDLSVPVVGWLVQVVVVEVLLFLLGFGSWFIW